MPRPTQNAAENADSVTTLTVDYNNHHPDPSSGATIEQYHSSPAYTGHTLAVGELVYSPGAGGDFYRGTACVPSVTDDARKDKFLTKCIDGGISEANADVAWREKIKKEGTVCIISTKRKTDTNTTASASVALTGRMSMKTPVDIPPRSPLKVEYMSNSQRTAILKRTAGPTERAGGQNSSLSAGPSRGMAACDTPMLVPCTPANAVKTRQKRVAFVSQAVSSASIKDGDLGTRVTKGKGIMTDPLSMEAGDAAAKELHTFFTLVNVFGLSLTSRANLPPGAIASQEDAFVRAPGQVNTDTPLGKLSMCFATSAGVTVDSVVEQQLRAMAALGYLPHEDVTPFSKVDQQKIIGALYALSEGMNPFTPAGIAPTPYDNSILWRNGQIVKTPEKMEYKRLNKKVAETVDRATATSIDDIMSSNEVYAISTNNSLVKAGKIVQVLVKNGM